MLQGCWTPEVFLGLDFFLDEQGLDLDSSVRSFGCLIGFNQLAVQNLYVYIYIYMYNENYRNESQINCGNVYVAMCLMNLQSMHFLLSWTPDIMFMSSYLQSTKVLVID